MKKLAIYAGSFNPFHKGHYDILLKAEMIFDEVFIGRGINLEKEPSKYEMPLELLGNRRIIYYEGLLTDTVKKLRDDYGTMPTIIRGLRNSYDLQYEITQYRVFQDLLPEVQMVSIFCDSKYDYISSSMIRGIKNYGEEHTKLYLP